MKRRSAKSTLSKKVAILFCLAAAGAGIARAVTLDIRQVGTNDSAEHVDFGQLTPAVRYHTTLHYLDIGHPTSPFRKLYLYTTNFEYFGKSESGLVVNSTDSIKAVPMFFRNFPSTGSFAAFSAADADLWRPVLEKSVVDFDVRKKSDALLFPTAGRSLVLLGIDIPFDAVSADYETRLVIEESSDFEMDVPELDHTPFHDVIILDVPMSIAATVVEESTFTATLHYRSDGFGGFSEIPATVRPDPNDPNRFYLEAPLPIGDSGPGYFEYYFTVVDQYANGSRFPANESEVIRANRVLPSEKIVRDLESGAGGQINVAVGDPRLPGLVLTVPPGSGLRRLTIAYADPVGCPPRQGVSPVRAFDIGPSGAGFDRPVTISLPYPDQDQDGWVDGLGVAETGLRMFRHDGVEWRALGGAVDVEANRVTARTGHFSLFGLFASSGTVTADTIRPKERIISPNGDGVWDEAVFDGLGGVTGSYEIQIFTIEGRRVRRIVDHNVWNGRDDEGQPVENGTYLYRVAAAGYIVTGMIAVAR